MVSLRCSTVVLLLCVAATTARHHAEARDVSADGTQPEAAAPAPDTERRHRRKRWYSNYGYQQPGYRDDGNPGPPPAHQPYDPFAYIYRRLDEIAAILRQPSPPSPPVLVPYPVYFSPGCGCPAVTPPNDAPTGTPQEPMPNITIPNRIGDNGDVDDYDDVPLRPLTFEPVKPDRPLTRPVPSVEHGSTQEGAPNQPNNPFQPNQPGRMPPAPFTPAPAFAQSSGANEVKTPQPSRCDIATLTCCHQRYTTNVCFNSFGCSGALRGNPCDTRTIASVVQVFQEFYRNN